MEKDRKIFIGIILILLLFTFVASILAFQEKKEQNSNKKESDAFLFKQEYESLNGAIQESSGKNYQVVTIPLKNPVDILNEEEAISLLESGTGLLYLGFPECPWCRSMIPVLLKTLDNMNISSLSYLNIFDIRDTYVLNAKNKLEKTKEGTEKYYKMLEILDEFLDEYTLETSKGKVVDTKEKRILAPSVIAIKNGKVVGIHVGTVASQKDPYQELTTKEEEELSNSYIKLINQVYDLNCDESC